MAFVIIAFYFLSFAANRNLKSSLAVTSTTPHEIEVKMDDLNLKIALRNTRRVRRAWSWSSLAERSKYYTASKPEKYF